MEIEYLGSTTEYFLVSHAKDSSRELFKTKRTMFAFMELSVLCQLAQERNVQLAGNIFCILIIIKCFLLIHRFGKCLKMGMKLEAIREDRTRGGRSTYQCSYTLPSGFGCQTSPTNNVSEYVMNTEMSRLQPEIPNLLKVRFTLHFLFLKFAKRVSIKKC